MLEINHKKWAKKKILFILRFVFFYKIVIVLGHHEHGVDMNKRLNKLLCCSITIPIILFLSDFTMALLQVGIDEESTFYIYQECILQGR